MEGGSGTPSLFFLGGMDFGILLDEFLKPSFPGVLIVFLVLSDFVFYFLDIFWFWFVYLWGDLLWDSESLGLLRGDVLHGYFG